MTLLFLDPLEPEAEESIPPEPLCEVLGASEPPDPKLNDGAGVAAAGCGADPKGKELDFGSVGAGVETGLAKLKAGVRAPDGG